MTTHRNPVNPLDHLLTDNLLLPILAQPDNSLQGMRLLSELQEDHLGSLSSDVVQTSSQGYFLGFRGDLGRGGGVGRGGVGD